MTLRTVFYAAVVDFITAFYVGHIGLLASLPIETFSPEDVIRPLLMWVTGGFVLGTVVALSLSGPARRHPDAAILGSGTAMAVVSYGAGHGMSKSDVLLICLGSLFLVTAFGFAAAQVERPREE
jgi:hypothetical protein